MTTSTDNPASSKPKKSPGKSTGKKDPRDTPAMRQHTAFKERNPGCILFFRMGDFYELFDDDAVLAARVLGLTLTERTSGLPMAGVPFHAVDGYLKRMLDAGYRVAVCDQVQDPKDAKGVVERAVTRVLTPGTLIEDTLLDEGAPNTVAAAAFLGSGDDHAQPVALALVEVSTGSFTVLECVLADAEGELARRGVSELVCADVVRTGRAADIAGPSISRGEKLAEKLGIPATPRDGWHFRKEEALEALRAQFQVASLEAFGLTDDDPCVLSAGALVRYLRETQALETPGGHQSQQLSDAARQYLGERSMAHLSPPKREQAAGYLRLDAAAINALEVVSTMRPGRSGAGAAAQADGSLAGIFTLKASRCVTPMGKRLLRDWLCRPLCDLQAIHARQACVGALVDDHAASEGLKEALGTIQDIARIGARIALGRATPRDLVALGASLGAMDAVAGALTSAESSGAFSAAMSRIEACKAALAPLAAEIARTCRDDAPAHLRNGGLVRDGVDPQLDEARGLERDAGEWLAQYQVELVEKYDLPSLKVGFNKVFGYYIELPAAQSQRAPDTFTRKQTLKNAERYITPQLKEFEDKVLTASDRALARETTIFNSLCAQVRNHVASVSEFAHVVAELDVLRCFAARAQLKGWCRPDVVDEAVLNVQAGRHPVLEELLGSDFVPNDAALGGEVSALSLITGPNMAGKSTFIRQVALLTLLAHTGSYVPAADARIGLTDRIFARIGADDALHRGQSTFMVEMVETASILHHAGPRSLVVLDEIGRGTSTLDGLSLAWAITEKLAGIDAGEDASPRTLFATHYHELTELAEQHPGSVANLHVTVREWEEDIVFLHEVREGAASESFGVHVARLAGVPKDVVSRANDVLGTLSVSHEGGAPEVAHVPAPQAATQAVTKGKAKDDANQLGLFGAPQPVALPHPVIEELKSLDLNSLTPLEAFDTLREFAERAAQGTSDGSHT